MPPSPQVTEPWRHSLGRGCRKLAWGAPTLALLVPSSLASGLPRLPGVDGEGGLVLLPPASQGCVEDSVRKYAHTALSTGSGASAPSAVQTLSLLSLGGGDSLPSCMWPWCISRRLA